VYTPDRTGKQIRVSGIAIWRIAEGKIVEHWHVTDQMSLMQQLGVIPPVEGVKDALGLTMRAACDMLSACPR